MARVFTDGGEMDDILFWDSYNGSLTTESAAPAPYESAFYYKITDAYAACDKLIDALDECYLRERVYLSSFSYANCSIPAYRNADVEILNIGIDTNGHVVASTPDGTLETSTSTVSAASWLLFEVYVKIADSGGRVVVYVDGNLFIDFTGDTKYSTYTNFDNLLWRPWLYLSGSGVLCLDDLALNDTTGGDDDSYCGDGVIIKVYPNDNGTDNDWTGNDADQVDNYLLVDEYPLDNDTTFVYHDGTDSGTQDQYALSDYDGTGKIITRIYPEARVRKTSASTNTVKLGVLPSGSVDQMSAARSLTTTYKRVVGDEYKTNPADAGAWEEADIDALEFVVEVG